MQYATTLKELREFRERNPLARIVLAGGIFDLLHVGHVKYLNFCKKQGDLLVVHVGSDKSSKVFKNEKQPVNPTEHRIETVKNLKPVDLVYSDDNIHRNLELLKALRPNVLILSRESTSNEEIASIKKELPTIEIVFNPRQDDGISTTNIIKKIQKSYCIL